ncbi:3'-5' exonuclease [Nocardia rhizosphaerihabitans]|uniref:Uncharacterized protein n=1 Tax=Nocardia rhizosphaerihabitans TaxID=1691570 RepID=A0ABQ2L3M9_9NOCA|nr:hypothetical protein [Nocardia rhizosphaerihabitans]GGO01401.1 hypothetical protein GCM10011610_71160 [Nocardia rhizosphaerihabitans]
MSEDPWPSTSLVSIDVEPGGRTTPFGYIGIAEIIGNDVETSWMVKFRSPHYRWPATSIDPAPPFGQIWPYIDAFIADRLVASYGSSYDIKSLASLIAVEGCSARPIPFIDGLQLARSLSPRRSGSLQELVLELNLLTREELAELHSQRSSAGPVNKWLLHDAEDDALANARLLLQAADGPFNVDKIISLHNLTVRPMAPPSTAG